MCVSTEGGGSCRRRWTLTVTVCTSFRHLLSPLRSTVAPPPPASSLVVNLVDECVDILNRHSILLIVLAAPDVLRWERGG